MLELISTLYPSLEMEMLNQDSVAIYHCGGKCYEVGNSDNIRQLQHTRCSDYL